MKIAKRSEFLLSNVLELHQRYASRTPLNLSLCDGYLYENNPCYKNVRDSVLALGGQYTTDDYCHYRVFHASTLFEILREKRIVYSDNVTRLLQIEALRPKRFYFRDFSSSFNYVHHESSHILADHIFSASEFAGMKHKDRDQVEALRIEFAEALASTNDLFGSFGLADPLAATIYQFATGWRSQKEKAYQRVFDAIGYSGAYKCTFFGFLHSYMLYRYLSRKDVLRILKLLFPGRNFSAVQLKALTEIMTWNGEDFLLGEVKVSNFYFRLLFERERTVIELLDFDFMSLVERHPSLLARLNVVSDVVEKGSHSEHFKSLRVRN